MTTTHAKTAGRGRATPAGAGRVATTPGSTTTSGQRSSRSSSSRAGCSWCSGPGWGKSAVYFVATALMRGLGAGPTVIISPLLALMRNQIEAAERAGIRAATINSTNIEDWSAIRAQVDAGEVDVLLVSPERLNNPTFRDEVLPQLTETAGPARRRRGALHLRLGPRLPARLPAHPADDRHLPPGIPVLATTATANARVTADVAEQLGPTGGDVLVLRGSLDRESLHLAVLGSSAEQRLAWLGEHLGELEGSGSSTRSRSRPPRRSPSTCGRTATPSRRTPGRPRPPNAWPSSRTCSRGGSRRSSRPVRSGWASTPGSASWSTSAPRRHRSPTTSRSAAPGAAPARQGDPAARPRGPRHLALLRLARVPARAARAHDPARARGERRADVHRRPGDPGRPRAAPASRRCSRSSTSTGRSTGCAGAGRRPGRTGSTTRSATTGWRPRGATSRPRCWRTPPPTAAGCASCASSSTTRAPPTAAAATTAAGSSCPARSPRPPSRRPANGSADRA